MSELTEEGVNVFEVSKILTEVADMEFVSIRMIAEGTGRGRRIGKGIGDLVTPDFD